MAVTALDDLRTRAERCLANPAPTIAEAHELAAETLALLALYEEALTAAEDTPYRGSNAPPRRDASPSALVVLERRLEEALEEITRLRKRESSPK